MPPLTMTGVPSGSVPTATAYTPPSWPVRTWQAVARWLWDQRVCQGRSGHMWADEFTVHVLIGGQLVKTVPSSLDAEDLATLKMRGASPAGPPPAAPAPAKAGVLPGGTVIEVDRAVDGDGIADLAGQRVKIGAEPARGLCRSNTRLCG